MVCTNSTSLEYYSFQWVGNAATGTISYRVTGTLDNCGGGSSFPDLSHFIVGLGCPLEDLFGDETELEGTVTYFLNNVIVSTGPASIEVDSAFGGLKFDEPVLKSAACGNVNGVTHDALFTFTLPSGFFYQECCVDLNWEGGSTKDLTCNECITGLCCGVKG